MAGFVLSKISRMRSALDKYLDTSPAYKSLASASGKGSKGKEPGCLDEILVWVRTLCCTLLPVLTVCMQAG
jgi:hypothetical protein